MTQARRSVGALLVVTGLLVAAGGALRLSSPERTPLSAEELIHLYAGRALERGAGPRLPSGVLYERDIVFSRIVGAVEPHVRSGELAVRLPSALLGTAALALFALVAFHVLGSPGAVWATLLFAVDPTQIELSRYGRFYPLQLLLGLLALAAAWRVVAPATGGAAASSAPAIVDPTEPRGAAEPLSRWAWAAAALACFAAATRVQVTTLTVAFGCLMAFALAGGMDLRERGSRAWRESVPLQLTVLAFLAAAVFALVARGLLDGVLVRAQSAPAWSRARPVSSLGYASWLWEDSSGGILLAALGFAVLLVRRRRLALFLGAWFGVPFLLHSLVLPMRARQYLLLATPALFLAEGAAAAWLVEVLRARFGRLTETGGRRVWRAAVMVIPGALVLLAAAPATRETAYGFQMRARPAMQPDWRAAGALIRADPSLAALPLGGTHPLPALYYAGRVDFAVRLGLRERWMGFATGEDGVGYGWMPVGAPDMYAGVPVLPDPDAVRQRFGPRGAVLIAASAAELANHSLDPRLLPVLTTRASDVCRGRCGSLHVYLWRFQDR